MSRPSFPEVYGRIVRLVSTRSTCKRLQVGALLVSPDFQQVYAIGYNGGIRGQDNDSCDPTKPGHCGDLHAEVNCLVKCRVNDPTKILFLTHSPCENCSKLVVNSGVSAVYFLEEYRSKAGLDILKKSNIPIYRLISIIDSEGQEYLIPISYEETL